MTRPRTAVVVAVVVLALAPAAGVAIEDPSLFAFVPDPGLQPGTSGDLTVQILNEDDTGADPVATAENVRATLSAGESPIVVNSGTTVVGDVEDGGVGSVTFDVRVPAGTAPGEYELPLEVTYVADDEELTRTLTVTVRVEAAPRFVVDGTETTASVGDRGTLGIDLRNAGSAPATDVTLTLRSDDPALSLGAGTTATAYVGRLDVDETSRVEVRLDVAEGATVRPYALGATVDYEGPDGEQRSRSFPVSVTPQGEPDFAVESVRADLRVGSEGTVRATVENTGDSVARDAAVRLAVPWANATDPPAYPVGDLEPGGAAEVRFSTAVPAGLDPGVRRVEFRVEHASADGERRVSGGIGASVDLRPRQSPVAVEPVNATLEVDGEGHLEVRLRNRGEAPITDVRATLTATDPLSSNDPSAFVPRLEPGAATVVRFHVEVSEDAVPGSHAVSVSLAYDDESGNRRAVADVPVGVSVVEPPGSGFPIAAVVVALLAVAGAGVWWYRRR